jgi:plastocyanin
LRPPDSIEEVNVRRLLPVLLLAVALVSLGVVTANAHGQGSTLSTNDGTTHRVTIPDEDRFTPFALTIHVGDRVKWINNDSDDHTVVSDDAFDTAGHKGTDHLIPANGGTFVLRFRHSGMFVYYCRFHAHLDSFNQPVAPGPDGGIQDNNGNFGTPMSGVITVLSD